MKKFFIFLLCIGLACGGYFGYKKITATIKENKRIEKAKEGWYVEVLSEYINVREKPLRTATLLTKVNKGEIYEVTDYNVKDPTKYWYQIVLKDGTSGWIADPKGTHYLKDHNGTIDVATPTLKFKEDEYNVISINDINYKHLDVWDDRDDYKITHVVFHEVDASQGIDQYWIQYTITDGSGKSASKVQKIVFEKRPSESEVKPFSELKR